MNSIKFKGFGLIIISIFVMTTLLSCTKLSQEDQLFKEIEELKVESSLLDMRQEIKLVAINIQEEQDFFKNTAADLDYDEFAEGLEKSFDEIEADFSKAHSIVIKSLDQFKSDYKQSEQVQIIDQIDKEQMVLSSLFQDLYSYHYMILETDLVLQLFTNDLDALLTYLANGNLTSNEYNADLEDVMTKYSELLIIDDKAMIDEEFLEDSSQIEETLRSLDSAKSEIQAIVTNTEVDSQVNELVLNLFEYIYKSVQAVLKYTQVINPDVYMSDKDVKIDEGALEYVNEVLKGINSLSN